MFYYLLYGKVFLSDIKLLNIPQISFPFDTADATIHQGSTACNISDEVNFFMSEKSSFVRFKYGALKIINKNEIIYSIRENYSPECVTPFILGWGMALILTQMGYSAFHCSALCHNNLGFLVSGASGAGKSTTALELIKNGCKYLTDDIAIVNSYEDMMIPPAFPIQKVCPDVSLNLDEQKIFAINNDRGKYSYLNLENYCDHPVKLSVIFQLQLEGTDKVEIKEVIGIDRYLRVLECLFLGVRYSMSRFPEQDKFNSLKIAGNIKLYTITRPIGKNTLDEITTSILKILNEQGAN